jgi:NAD(P)-dependent dehydrogenase (short-subunit alcohol dehydrogenase family)
LSLVELGPIATDFAGGILRDDEQVRAALAAHAALGHVGEPDDIGYTIAALLTSRRRWVTGERLEVSGGIDL